MKKIGIITHYYKSKNYGGNLQAYALCQVLSKNGYDAEQISFPRVLSFSVGKGWKRFFKRNPFSLFKLCVRKSIGVLMSCRIRRENRRKQIDVRREKAFLTFNQEKIPHSLEVYNANTISHCVKNYDVFITGSDQVWNFYGDVSIYFLDFVPSNKIKFSYAASIARAFLTEGQKESVYKSLQNYKAVSVREKSAVKLLEGLSPVTPQVVLDPTLLLTREDWDKVCAERVIKENYLFCYFLGDNIKERILAKKFARIHNLRLVALPHTAGIKLMDRKFGDERLYDASPEQFLSLIKHAKYVFTDSFHAVVFSYIYQKQYFVFNRSKKGEMSSRIVDITELFHQDERFCNGEKRESLEYIQSLPDIDYTIENKDFENIKKESIEFLEKNLKD